MLENPVNNQNLRRIYASNARTPPVIVWHDSPYKNPNIALIGKVGNMTIHKVIYDQKQNIYRLKKRKYRGYYLVDSCISMELLIERAEMNHKQF